MGGAAAAGGGRRVALMRVHSSPAPRADRHRHNAQARLHVVVKRVGAVRGGVGEQGKGHELLVVACSDGGRGARRRRRGERGHCGRRRECNGALDCSSDPPNSRMRHLESPAAALEFLGLGACGVIPLSARDAATTEPVAATNWPHFTALCQPFRAAHTLRSRRARAHDRPPNDPPISSSRFSPAMAKLLAVFAMLAALGECKCDRSRGGARARAGRGVCFGRGRQSIARRGRWRADQAAQRAAGHARACCGLA